MLKIKLVRKIKGENLVKELEETYNSKDNLEKIFKEEPTNAKLYMDLDNWTYFLENPDEEVEEDKIIYTDRNDFKSLEIGLLSLIKDCKPKSVRELASMINNDLTTIQRKKNKLNKDGVD